MEHIADKGREERHESPDREVERHIELAELGARVTAESEIRLRQHGHDGKGRKAEAEQHPEGVAPADHEIFPEQIIAEEEEQLPYRPEGREPPDQHPDAERDDKM